MKLWLTIGCLIVAVALLGIYFFELELEFSFFGFLEPVLNLFENIASILRFVLNWFFKLIGWVTPDTITA